LIQVDLEEKADNSAAITTLKKTTADSLRERFDMTSPATAKHPFVVATVLDPVSE